MYLLIQNRTTEINAVALEAVPQSTLHYYIHIVMASTLFEWSPGWVKSSGMKGKALYRSAFVITRVAGIVAVVVMELVAELRCHIPSKRSSPESLGQVA